MQLSIVRSVAFLCLISWCVPNICSAQGKKDEGKGKEPQATLKGTWLGTSDNNGLKLRMVVESTTSGEIEWISELTKSVISHFTIISVVKKGNKYTIITESTASGSSYTTRHSWEVEKTADPDNIKLISDKKTHMLYRDVPKK